MPVDLRAAPPEALVALIKSHEGAGLRTRPLCVAARIERDRRIGLDHDATRALLIEAARDGRFVTFGDVARASGRRWSERMRAAAPPHLETVNAAAAAEGRPLLGALVTTRAHAESGRRPAQALADFARNARALGLDVPNGAEAAVLAEEQRRCFAWAADIAGPTQGA
ncbi:MAG: hypothetical protein AAF192_22300 [Pseudomonadota bacterium]